MSERKARNVRGPAGVPIYAGTRVIGRVYAGTFHKSASAALHQLRRPPAWAVDVDSLAQAERAGASRVMIHDRDSGKSYSARIDTIRAQGLAINRGAGRQLALPLAAWHVDGGPASGPEQLALFGGLQ